MERINRVFRWGYFLTVVFAAGARSVPGTRGETIEGLCVCFVIFGFLVWALIGYVYAWVLAIRDIRTRMRPKSRELVLYRGYPR